MTHYRHQARDLPWRLSPETPVPEDKNHAYRVWLSEVMLQQTTVAAVKSYFLRFTTLWPSVEHLAAADDAAVMREWAGLGYYARARNMLKAARVVAGGDGTFPQDEVALLALPGIGPYTAAAISSIAFGRRAVVIDGNVERVIARLAAIELPLPDAKPQIREIADALTPDENAGDFAQAMMDLGATICTPRSPRCADCPIAFACAAHAEDRAINYPVKAPKRAKPERRGTAYWIEHGGKVALLRRSAKGLLGGMLALPSDGWDGKSSNLPPDLNQVPQRFLGEVRHAFTHFTLTLSVVAIDGSACQVPDDWEWWPLENLEQAGLPTLFAKAAKLGQARTKESLC